jgi:tetratricopeptide (TPR) repeat protein
MSTMTQASLRSFTSPRRHGVWLALAGLLAANALLAGCGMSMLHGRSEPVDRRGAVHVAPASKFEQTEARARLAPAEPYWPFHLAELYVAADSLPEAEAALQRALARNAAYAPALSLLSKLYFDASRHEEAIRLLEPVAAHPERFSDEEREALLAGLALHYEALDQFERARGVMAQIAATRRGPVRSTAVYLGLRGPAPDSVADLADRVRHDDPGSAVAQNNYGISQLRAGDPLAARRAFQAALRIDSRLPGPYYNLAILEKYYALDDSTAARFYRSYRERAHDDPDGLAEVFGKSEPKPLAEKRDER